MSAKRLVEFSGGPVGFFAMMAVEDLEKRVDKLEAAVEELRGRLQKLEVSPKDTSLGLIRWMFIVVRYLTRFRRLPGFGGQRATHEVRTTRAASRAC